MPICTQNQNSNAFEFGNLDNGTLNPSLTPSHVSTFNYLNTLNIYTTKSHVTALSNNGRFMNMRS